MSHEGHAQDVAGRRNDEPAFTVATPPLKLGFLKFSPSRREAETPASQTCCVTDLQEDNQTGDRAEHSTESAPIEMRPHYADECDGNTCGAKHESLEPTAEQSAQQQTHKAKEDHQRLRAKIISAQLLAFESAVAVLLRHWR